MFYATIIDNQLRFGDVLAQQTIISPHIHSSPDELHRGRLEINVINANLSVVLTPCCSISNNMIVVSPFQKINSSWFNNPYLAEDLTRMNRLMAAEQSLPPTAWVCLSAEEKQAKLAEGIIYAYIDCFVYDQNELFQKYLINRQDGNNKIKEEISYYQIDFRNVIIINSENIKSPEGLFLTKKIAQLSIETRSDLRKKIGYYYSNTPPEDRIEE